MDGRNESPQGTATIVLMLAVIALGPFVTAAGVALVTVPALERHAREVEREAEVASARREALERERLEAARAQAMERERESARERALQAARAREAALEHALEDAQPEGQAAGTGEGEGADAIIAGRPPHQHRPDHGVVILTENEDPLMGL